MDDGGGIEEGDCMLFLIPARAGSKRLPEKNKRVFCGLPLWQWSVATAMRCSSDDDGVHVSTNDTDILTTWPATPRPSHLCGDDTTTQEVISYIWERFPLYASICLLQPTSPTRPDSLVRQLIAHGGQVRSVTNGVPNGQCYVYRKGHEGWIDVETERGVDIDTLSDFEAAEKQMMEKFK